MYIFIYIFFCLFEIFWINLEYFVIKNWVLIIKFYLLVFFLIFFWFVIYIVGFWDCFIVFLGLCLLYFIYCINLVLLLLDMCFLFCYSFKIYWYLCICCVILYKIIIIVVRYLKIVVVLLKYFCLGYILKKKICFWFWNWINCFNVKCLVYFFVVLLIFKI